MKKTPVFLMLLVLALCVGAQAATLPEGYTEVEYIESQGAGYIDTKWNTAGVDSSYSYELTFEFGDAAPSVDSFIFGSYDTSVDPYDFRMGVISADSNGTTRISFGDTSSSNAAAVNWTTTTDKQTVKVDVAKSGSKWNYSVTKDGGTTGVTNAAGTVSTSPITDSNVWLFALSDGTLNGAWNRMEGKVYALKIWEDGTLVRDYVPCYRTADEVAGLYDLANGEFYPGVYDMNITYPGQEKALGICNTGIVVNADTGEIYYGQHIDRRHGQASMTKIMTAILTIENVPDVNQRALVAIDMDHDDGSSMNLVTGEQHTIDNVLYGMMLPSGNDAAQLLARTVGTMLGGNFGTFVDMMNAKAHELGMVNTVYEGPQGGYQTTAYDYAKLCEYGMRNELFRKYAYESFWTIEADPEYNVVEHNLTNANQLMPGLPYEYEGITGIKPGSTQATRAHNAASATRVINGKEVNLITIIFGANHNDSKHNRFTNCTAFLDYGFAKAEAEPYTVTAEGNKLTIYNPVSGYTVEAVISGADTAYTGEPIEAATVTTTYSSGTWNPNWDIKYENNVEKGTATASITYDGQTASCTFEIVEPTVTLTENSREVETLVVDAGQVYDLNSGELIVNKGLVVNKGGKIINGVLSVKKDAVVSLGDNGGYVPVWSGETVSGDIYVLYPAAIKAGKTVVSTDGGTSYSFGYKMTENASGWSPYANAVTASGAEKIKFGVALDLDDAGADYTFSHTSIEKMADIDPSATSDEFFKINLNLAGTNNPLTKVRVAPVIKVPDLGFRYVGEDTGEAVADGEYVARVDNQFYWSLEDAVAAAEARASAMGSVVDVMVTKDIHFARPVTIEVSGMVCIKTHCRVTISGPVTFDGGNRDGKTILFFAGKDAELTLDGVTVQNYRNTCSDGSTRAYGAVARAEQIAVLTMKNCAVKNCSGNTRGAIYITGTASLNIDTCVFENNTAVSQYGGAIAVYTAESIRVKNSTFTGNSAKTYGGAIALRQVTSGEIENCFFTGNAAKTTGGAVHFTAGELSVSGCTMSGNTAKGETNDVQISSGIFVLAGETAIDRVALADGVAITVNNALTVSEPIILDAAIGQTVLNGSKTAEVCADFVGATDDAYVTEEGVLKSSKNYVAQVGSTMYESMADAFEATKNATSATTIYLIGSETFAEETTLTLGKYVNVVVNGDDVTISGPVTIDGQGVTNLSGTHTVSVEGRGKLTLKNGVTVKGIVSTTATSGAIRVYVADLALDGATIENCTGVRGAVYMAGTTSLTVTNSTFRNNTATDRGGALFLYGAASPTTITGSTFEGNSAAGNGDTVFLTNGATLNLADTIITGNGSNVYVNAGTLTLAGAMAIDTVELVPGQSITLNDTVTIAEPITIIGTAGRTVLTGSKVAEYYTKFVSADERETIDSAGLLKGEVAYVAEVDGEKYESLVKAVEKAKTAGATEIALIGSESFTEKTTIALDGIMLTVGSGMDVTLAGDLILTGGEAAQQIINVSGGSLTLDGVTVKDHTNTSTNGAVAVALQGSLTLRGGELSGLKAKRGALYLNGYAGAMSFSATGTKFTNNTSTSFGGAIATFGVITMTLTDCTFTGNTAEVNYGGAIATYGAASSSGCDFTISGCTFENNSTAVHAGAIYLYGGSNKMTVTNTSFKNNTAGTHSGVSYIYGGTVVYTNCTFTGNTAETATAGENAAIQARNSTQLTFDGCAFSGNDAYDVYNYNCTLTLKGETAIEKIYLASGKTVTPDSSLTLKDTAKPIGLVPAATSGSVLAGSNIASTYGMFAVVDADGAVSETLTIGADGKLAAK